MWIPIKRWNTCTARNGDYVEKWFTFVVPTGNKQCKVIEKNNQAFIWLIIAYNIPYTLQTVYSNWFIMNVKAMEMSITTLFEYHSCILKSPVKAVAVSLELSVLRWSDRSGCAEAIVREKFRNDSAVTVRHDGAALDGLSSGTAGFPSHISACG